MQLDRTNVVVRARSIAEIADLALVLTRAYPKSVIAAFFVGALPWFLVNCFLLGPLVISDLASFDYDADNDSDSQFLTYQYVMVVLVFLQTPIAGALTTLSLGRSVFEAQPSLQAVWQDARSQIWRWGWILGWVRGPIPALVLVWLFWSSDFSGLAIFFLFVMFGSYGLLRSLRPFMPEILLLERCPLRAQPNKNQLTVGKRAQFLHRPIAGDCFSRFLVTSIAATVIASCTFLSIMSFRGVLFNSWEWGKDVYLIYYPLSLWIAAGFTVVIRFLNYLDARIRLEGWEVQLSVMAEAIRQFGTADVSAPTLIRPTERTSSAVGG